MCMCVYCLTTVLWKILYFIGSANLLRELTYNYYLPKTRMSSQMGSLRTRNQLPLNPIKTIRGGGGGGGGIEKPACLEEEENEDEPLSPKARLFHAPGLNCCIITILGSKTKLDIDRLRDIHRDEAIIHPRYTKVLVVNGDEMRWRKTKVNIDDHIIVPDISPGSIESPDRFVEDYVARLTGTPMDTSKPLWEIHLLDIQTSDAAGVIISRYHHSIGDGSSLMSILFASSRRSVKPAPASVGIPRSREMDQPAPRAFSRFWASLGAFWNTCVGIFFFLMTVLFLRDTETPVSSRPGVELAPKRFVRRTLDLGDIKLVKNAMKVTVNDVLLGITEGGLSRYLNRRYGHGLQPSEKMKNHLPRSLRIRATHYVNLRALARDRFMAGSRVGYFLLPLLLALRDDPLECIREAKASVDRRKLSYEASFSFSLSAFVLKFFGLKAAAALYHRILCNTTVTYSNMIGSFEEIDCFGHPLSYIAFGTYGYPRMLSINFISYVDKMTLLIVVDEKAIPDPQQLCNDVEAALKAAVEACSKCN